MRFKVEIKNGQLFIESRDLSKFNGQKVEVIIVPIGSPEYFQHKYYRGYLLPAIAEAMGERDESYVHLFLKSKYLLTKCNHVDEIPKSQLRRGIYVAQLNDLLNMSVSLSKYITGAIIVSDIEGNLCGWIPSLALVTSEKMKKFIYDCENFLTEIGGSLTVEAMEARKQWITR